MNYDSMPKFHWRRWQWNRVDEKLRTLYPRKRRDECIALYLVGPEDLDRGCAKEFGFKDHNLIAVDLCKEHINKVRKAGHIGICANLLDVVLLWPADLPIDVIIADFTCGLETRRAAYTIDALLFSQAVIASRTILSTNWQRGRDPSSNSFRDEADEFGRIILNKFGHVERFRLAFSDIKKNRAKAFILTYWYFVWKVALNKPTPGTEYKEFGLHAGWRVSSLVDWFLDAVNPSFHAYRQGRRMPYMDTVVCSVIAGSKNNMRPQHSLRCFLSKEEGGYGKVPSDDVLLQYKPLADKLRREIAAARAIRTMRISGKL